MQIFLHNKGEKTWKICNFFKFVTRKIIKRKIFLKKCFHFWETSAILLLRVKMTNRLCKKLSAKNRAKERLNNEK